jgi:RNA polymerase sigma-70 factor (ECF subfamily)
MEDRDRVAMVAVASGTTPDGEEIVPSAVENNAPPEGSSSIGDRRAALEDLMDTHGDAVLRYCICKLGDHEVAEDARQQTFLEALRDFDRVEPRSLGAWLFGIAKNRCLDAIRSQQRHASRIENDEEAVMNTHDPGSGPSARIEHAQSTAALEECLQSLQPEVRMAVRMRYHTDLTYEELAVQLSSTPGALQMKVARALAKLRECLESKGVFHD